MIEYSFPYIINISKIIIEDHCSGKLVVNNSQNGAQFILRLPLL